MLLYPHHTIRRELRTVAVVWLDSITRDKTIILNFNEIYDL